MLRIPFFTRASMSGILVSTPIKPDFENSKSSLSSSVAVEDGIIRKIGKDVHGAKNIRISGGIFPGATDIHINYGIFYRYIW